MAKIMQEDAVYLTIIRHPIAQLKSTFQYWKLGELAGIPKTDVNPLLTYFSNLSRFEAEYMKDNNPKRFCVPTNFSMTRNTMSHTFGMPLGFPKGTQDISRDEIAINEYLSAPHAEFCKLFITFKRLLHVSTK